MAWLGPFRSMAGGVAVSRPWTVPLLASVKSLGPFLSWLPWFSWAVRLLAPAGRLDRTVIGFTSGNWAVRGVLTSARSLDRVHPGFRYGTGPCPQWLFSFID
jgi:hypothetical protein